MTVCDRGGSGIHALVMKMEEEVFPFAKGKKGKGIYKLQGCVRKKNGNSTSEKKNLRAAPMEGKGGEGKELSVNSGAE